ncbi:MAG: hypothetical protein ACLSCD_04920 [Subdoligranulum sp.]
MNLWNTNEEFRAAIITGIWNDIVSKVKGFCDQPDTADQWAGL